jgi:collagen type III alpha
MASSSGNHSDAEHTSALDESAPSGLHAAGGDGYVDFDEYIDIQLRKAATTIKSTDVLTAVVGAGTLLTAYLLAFIVCDQWLIPGGFGGTARVLLLSALLLAVVGWIGWKVVWPWRRRVNGLYSASTIEKASPGFKGSLVNLVDLLRADREVPPEIYRSLERRAAVALTHVDVRETVDRRSLLRLSMALFAVVVLFCGYWILSPKNPATSLWRAIAPASETSVATRTKIDSVKPGDVDVVARSQVDVTAEVRGQLPPQAALYYTTADRKFLDERIDARPTAEGSREFHFVINGDNGAGILQDMTYRIVAGDDATKDYKIHVIQPPSATIDSIRLDYPEYTRLGSATQTTGAIDALEGTRVTLRATANMPLRSASLQFFDDESASKRAEEVPMHVEGDSKLQADWTLQVRSDGTYPHFYRIFCTSVGGESERNPSLYALEIRADRPPEIVLVDPKTDLDLPANAELPLRIEARDPDFALTYINLKIEKDGAAVPPTEIYDGHDHPDQQVNKTYKWSLKEYHFKPKETVTYWLEAQDNRKPLANTTGSSPRLRIHITDPVPESQVKKNFDMAERRQQEEAKRSDDEKAQQKSDDDQLADASKPRQDRPKPQQQKANAQREQEPPEKMQHPQQENGDDPKSKGGQGSGGEGQGAGDGDKESGDKSTGDKGGGDKGRGDKGSGDKGENGQSQKLNPDDPASDSKVLQKLHDQFQKDAEQGGSQSKPQDTDKDSKRGAADNKKESDKSQGGGSESKPDDQSAKENGDNKGGQPGAKPQAGTKPDSKDEKNQDGKNDDGKNQDGKNQDGKNQDGKNPQGKNAGEKNPDGQTPDGQNPDKSATPNDPGSKPEPNQSRQPDGQNPTQGQNPTKGDKNTPSAPDKDAKANRQGDKQPDGSQAGEQPKGEKQPDANKQTGDKQAGQNQAAEKKAGERQLREKQGGDKQAGDGQKQDPGQQQGQRRQPGDDSQSGQNESRGKNEKGQPSSGDEKSASDNKNTGRSSDNNSQPDPGAPKPDASKPTSGANSSDKNGDRNPSGSPQQQQDASPRNRDQDQAGKRDSSPAAQQNGQPQRGEKSPDRKDPTKGTDPTSRDADRSQRPQQDAGAKPRPGQPQDDVQNVKTREKPPGEKPDDKAKKGKPANSQEPEDIPKGVDQNTDQAHAKGLRNEQQPNKRGDEQSDVGETGDTKRTFDKNSPLTQEGTKSEGAKQKTSEQNSAPKDGDERRSPADPSARPQPGQEGSPPKPGEKPQDGQSQQGQPQQGQPGKPGKDGQPAPRQQGEKSQPGKDGQSKSGEGKPGEPGQSQASGKEGGGKEPSKAGGKPGAGMGAGKGKDNGGGGFNNGNGSGPGEGLVNTEKEANLDYARKATDLILNRLQGQLSRGQVDEKVLKQLGWTKDEIRRFVERMRRQAQSEQGGNTPADEARRLQFEETLKSLDLKRPSKSRSGSGLQKVGGLEIESHRSTPPAEFRELYNAYTKSLSNSQTPRDKK